jgi:putative transposase
MWYRRADVKGGTYFFIINPAERKQMLLVIRVDTLREAMWMVKAKHPFNIDAMVLLPRSPSVWTLPVSNCDYLRDGC